MKITIKYAVTKTIVVPADIEELLKPYEYLDHAWEDSTRLQDFISNNIPEGTFYFTGRLPNEPDE